MIKQKSKSRRSGGKNSFSDSGLSTSRGLTASRSLNSAPSRGFSSGFNGFAGIIRILRWTLGLGLCAGLLYGLTAGLFGLYDLATTSDFFALKQVDIRGARHFRREDVLLTAGLSEGKNSLTISISEVESALSKNPWVERVAVKRHLPGTFEIQFTERVPVFWMLKDGALQYADRAGTIIAPVEAGNFLSLPTLEILPGGESLQGQVASLLESLHKAGLPLDLAAASTLRLSSAKGLEIVMGNMELTLCISPDDWDGNLRRLNSVLRDLARRGELKNTREIWLADKSVWVIMQQPIIS